MFPELLKIPLLNIPLNTYGLLLAVAFTLGLQVAARMAGCDGLDKRRVYDLGLWILVAALIGAKLLLVINEWDSLSRDPRQFLSFSLLRSGGVFYGGFIASVIVTVIVARKHELPLWRTADAIAPGIALGHAIGRLGCFFAGCCWGEPTTAAWGVHFSERGHEITGVPTRVIHLTDSMQQSHWANQMGGLDAPIYLHPTQLYETATMVVLFVVLLAISRRRLFKGQVMLAYITLYAGGRLVIEFWRNDPRGSLIGLSTSQLIAALIFFGSVCVYRHRISAVR